jgi:hypothetical protein
MDITKYIDDNLDEILDEILDNTDSYITNTEHIKKKVSFELENEEATNEEIQEELFQDYYDKELQTEFYKSIEQEEPEKPEIIEEEISQYKLNLLNLFLIHYNEKYEKQENYFTNIKNIEKDTSNPMELFFETMIEFKKMKEIIKLKEKEDIEEKEEKEDNEYLDYYFYDTDEEKIEKMLLMFPDGYLYCLDYNGKRILSPSLIVCLNYIINNKENLFEKKDWIILNLRDN